MSKYPTYKKKYSEELNNLLLLRSRPNPIRDMHLQCNNTNNTYIDKVKL